MTESSTMLTVYIHICCHKTKYQKKKSDIDSDEANLSATSEEKSFDKVEENWGENWVIPAITNHTS